MKTVEFNKEALKNELNVMRNVNKTMVLATKTKDGEAEISYAPYVLVDGKYYIIMSKIATHYNNVNDTKCFQGMLLEDENKAVNTFFRRRAIFNFELDSKVSEEGSIVEAFLNDHGNIVETVMNLDFDIFKLNLKDGRLVIGPGQAFRFDKNEDITTQITENTGHNSK